MNKVPQYVPIFDGDIAGALGAYVSTDPFLTEFTKTAEFERQLSTVLGGLEAICVPNGTQALEVVGRCLGLGPADTVIVPNFTMIASAYAFSALGCRIKFVDVEPATLCMDFNRLAEAFDSTVKAVVFVAINGRSPSVGIEKFRSFCKEQGVWLIEDASQALGSFHPMHTGDATPIGSIGDVSTTSFSPAKIISTGQGGAIFTPNPDLAQRIRQFKDFGRVTSGGDIHDDFGGNYRFTDLQAVVGIEQMRFISHKIVKKKEIYGAYLAAFENAGLSQYLIKNDTKYCAPWFIELRCETRDQLAKWLAENGVATRNMYPPLSKQKFYSRAQEFPVSEEIGSNGLWLPSSQNLDASTIRYVVNLIRDYLT